MQKARDDLNVVQCCVGDETLGHLLPHLLEQLEVCQKSLTGFACIVFLYDGIQTKSRFSLAVCCFCIRCRLIGTFSARRL